jgi:branched-subunit amino acid ABC-type transport system permease component
MNLTPYAFFSQALAGLSSGMVVFCCALGLTIAFGTLKVLNLAHGSIFMIGMYVCYSVSDYLAISNGFFAGVLMGAVGAAFLGLVMEILLLRPIYRRDPLDQFMITFGAVFIFMDMVKLIWGTEYHTIAPPTLLRGALNIFGIVFPKYSFSVIVFGFILFGLAWFFVEKTRWGVIIRGVTVDRDMMGALGTNVPKVFTLTFSLACGLSGLGGGLSGALTCVAPGIDIVVLMESFIVIVIGGFGSISGAFIGSILFGLVNSFGILIIPKMAIGFPFFLMLIILIIRPFGLMGKPLTKR